MIAKLEQVIVGECTEGSQDPWDIYRRVTHVIRPDGSHLARVDSWREEKDREVFQWARQLAACCRRIGFNDGKALVASDDFDEIRTAVELIEKYSPR